MYMICMIISPIHVVNCMNIGGLNFNRPPRDCQVCREYPRTIDRSQPGSEPHSSTGNDGFELKDSHVGSCAEIPSPSLTWNLKMMVFNRNLLFQCLIFRFHVKL